MFNEYSFGTPLTTRDDGVNWKDVRRTEGAKDFKHKKKRAKIAKKSKKANRN